MDTEERNRLIAAKLAEGLSLSDVQKILTGEYGEQLTYLELRLLVADLDVDWKKQDAEKAPAKPATVDLSEPPPSASGTKVTLSRVVRPGSSVSGDVEFASGAKAEWFVDAMGRLGLNPAPGSSRPTEEDLRDFQIELQHKLTGE